MIANRNDEIDVLNCLKSIEQERPVTNRIVSIARLRQNKCNEIIYTPPFAVNENINHCHVCISEFISLCA